MILELYVDDDRFQVDVPAELLDEGEEFFRRMDRDMDQGWQMSREFVAQPDARQRCQIAADKILTALHGENRELILLMAGYILSRMPGATGVDIDTAGEMQNTRIIVDNELGA